MSSFLSHSVGVLVSVNLHDLTWNIKAARCAEIFAALTSSDGYQNTRLEIGSDPVASNVCARVYLSNDECFLYRKFPCS